MPGKGIGKTSAINSEKFFLVIMEFTFLFFLKISLKHDSFWLSVFADKRLGLNILNELAIVN